MMRSSLFIALSFSLLGCGGRVGNGGDDRDSGVTDASRDAVVDVPFGEAGVRCALEDGTPVCGWPGCPSAACKTCVAFTDRDMKLLPLSVCPPGIPTVFPEVNGHGVPCSACPNDDDVCAGTVLDLSCVRPPICSLWYSAGIRGCYFGDMTAWTPEAIPSATCPGAGFCGGSCGKCSAGESCAGRSPTHPIGVCTAISATFYNVCAHKPRNSAEACPRDGSGATDQACLIFKDPKPDDQAAADKIGVCVKRDLCVKAKASLPGGVFCVDGGGSEL